MKSSSSSTFPNGRTLAGWWRQFASIHASVSANRSVCPAFWIAHLDLHRVDAQVRVAHNVRGDPLSLAILRAAALAPDQPLEGLQRAVPISTIAVRRAARELEVDGLLCKNANASHAITDKGREALVAGTWARHADQRREFFFLRADASDHPPFFLPLAVSDPTQPHNGTAAFDVQHLLDCIEKPTDWKQRFGFPIDVSQALLPVDGEVNHEAWRRVVCHRLEKRTFMLLPKPKFRGYVVQSTSWALEPTPVWEWGDDGPRVFGSYTREPSLDEWREAWRQWATANGVPAADAKASQLERRGHRLRVTTTRMALDKLRGARNQPLLHEPWVLAGDDRSKAAVSLEIVAA